MKKETKGEKNIDRRSSYAIMNIQYIVYDIPNSEKRGFPMREMVLNTDMLNMQVYNLLKKEGFERFDITRHDRAYFYSQKEYNQFLRIFTTPFEKYTKDE